MSARAYHFALITLFIIGVGVLCLEIIAHANDEARVCERELYRRGASPENHEYVRKWCATYREQWRARLDALK